MLRRLHPAVARGRAGARRLPQERCRTRAAGAGLPDPERQTAGRPRPAQRPAVQGGPLRPRRPGCDPQLGDEVKVNYEGKLIDGRCSTLLERGLPAAMPLNGLIKGWQEALQLMRPGDEWILYVPPKLGYGAEGAGRIPPGAALIFRIELIDVLPGPKGACSRAERFTAAAVPGAGARAAPPARSAGCRRTRSTRSRRPRRRPPPPWYRADRPSFRSG